MKQGKSLVELAQSLTHIKAASKDYIVPTEKLTAVVDETDNVLKLAFQNGTKQKLNLNNWSRSQLSTYTDIPKNYFDRITEENPKLAADNINHGFERLSTQAAREGKTESRMLRTVDGNVRGLLSSRYRILDSYDMLETVLPVAQEHDLQVASSEITDKRLFLARNHRSYNQCQLIKGISPLTSKFS